MFYTLPLSHRKGLPTNYTNHECPRSSMMLLNIYSGLGNGWPPLQWSLSVASEMSSAARKKKNPATNIPQSSFPLSLNEFINMTE